MTQETTSEPKKRHSGRRFLGLVIVHLVVGVIGGSLWWYYDDSDLASVREHARKIGCPVTWADMRLKLADEERLRTWQSITGLSKRLPSYQEAREKRKDDWPIYKAWDPIPQPLRDHHQSLDPLVVNELGTLLDHLGDQPLVFHDQFTFDTPSKQHWQTLVLMRFMQEQMLLRDSSDAAVWGRRMLATCRSYAGGPNEYLSRISRMDAALTGIALRLADLKQSDPGIALDILNTTQTLHDDLRHALDGHFLIMLGYCAGSDQVWYLAGWYMPLVLRAGRQDMLEAILAARQDLRLLDGPGSLTWARATDAKFNAWRTNFPSPALYLQDYFVSYIPHYVYTGQRTALRGRLLAAELQGQPWPVDSFDPSGAVLRPIVRDGRVIAAYSVGDDGIDQGGDAKLDRIFPLYAKP